MAEELTSASTISQQPHNQVEQVSAVVHDLRMDILFTRLGAIYGQNWWNNYRTDSLLTLAKQEWSESLQRYDNQVLKEVLVVCREKKIYPPSLPQFMDCCKDIQNRRMPNPLKNEISKPASREVAEMHLKAMLKELRS